MKAGREGFGWALGLALASLGGCGGPIVLRRLPADVTGTLGPMQRCETAGRACQTDPNQDDSRFNDSGVVTLPLPSCPNGIDKILIQGGGTSSPVAIVQCAAAPPTPGGLPITQPGGAVGP